MGVQLAADPDIGTKDIEIQMLLEEEALCAYYGWTPLELEKQDAFTIECFKAILSGRQRREDKITNTARARKELKR